MSFISVTNLCNVCSRVGLNSISRRNFNHIAKIAYKPQNELSLGFSLDKFQIPLVQGRPFSTSNVSNKKREKTDRKNLLSSVGKKEEGSVGENISTMDPSIRGFGEIFPDETTPSLLYGNVKFSDLPIVHVSVSRNNTVMSVSDSKGLTKLSRSCGMDGFKNTKKGTNIAAQVTGQMIGMHALEKGFKNVRVAVQGLGPGRMASVKGLTLSGINIVSISDVTPVSFSFQPRPRKNKRL